MKTKRARQNVMPKTRLFTRKCTYYARIDNNSPGFVTENALAWFIHEWGGVAAASPRRYAESLWLSARSNLIPLAHAARLSRVACARPSEVRLPEKPSLSAEQSRRAAICARLFVNNPTREKPRCARAPSFPNLGRSPLRRSGSSSPAPMPARSSCNHPVSTCG